MKLLTALKKRENFPLLIILFVAFVLRFYKLGHESFWCDELHCMKESSPSLPLVKLFDYLVASDYQPPLFFLIQRVVFTILGRSDVIGRLWPAVAGVAAVWAMFRLGKEILNRELGLIAASLTCVNYFAIYYAREARPYSQLFLFTILSLFFLIRLIKTNSKRDMWFFALFATMTMYTHYFGAFLVISEFAVAFLLYWVAADRKIYLKRFVISWLFIAVCFSAWVPRMLRVNAMKTSWIASVKENFVVEYFGSFFGYSEFLQPIVVVLMLIYLMNVFRNDEPKLSSPVKSPLTLSLIVFSVVLFVSSALPYLRSALILPILWDRYEIIVLPVYLAAASYGMQLIGNAWAKLVVFLLFVGWSGVYLVATNKMYTGVHKTQFREMTAFIAADPKEASYPLVNDRIMWQEDYYLQKFGVKGEQFEQPREATINSILRDTTGKYAVDGFWLFDAHGAGEPAAFLDSSQETALKKKFVLQKEGRFYDAWAQLYVSKKVTPSQLTTQDFPPGDIADVGGKVVAIWNGFVTSNPIALPAGDYIMHIFAKGTQAQQVYPHVTVSVNGKVVGSYYATDNFQDVQFPYQQTGTDSARVTIGYDNDFMDPKTKDDRNLFLQKIDFLKKGQ
jgi:mannosyltransferase